MCLDKKFLVNILFVSIFFVSVFAADTDFDINIIKETNLFAEANTLWEGDGTPSYVNEKYYKITTDKSMQEISAILRSLSSMKGIQYYSNTDKKWQTLYHESTFIDDTKSKKALPDPLLEDVNDKDYYFLQLDNSLGTLMYRVNYRELSDQMLLTFTLAEPVKVGFITGIKSGNFKICVEVYKEGDDLYIYIVGKAKYQNVPFVEDRSNKSFNARIDAIYNWFEMKVLEESE